MGKNNGKKGKRTEYAKWISIMRKLDNEVEIKKEKEKEKQRIEDVDNM